MAIPPVSPGGPLPASTVNALITGVTNVALSGVVPASIAFGGSATLTKNGSVTFTNASYVALDGCFTGQFNNYRVVLNVTNRSVGSAIALNFRQNGTDVKTATYGTIRQQTSGTTTQAPLVSTAATYITPESGIAAGQTTDGYFDVYGPALGLYTAVQGTLFSWASGAPYLSQVGAQNSTASPLDGISFFPASGGTFTGAIRVYGYNNLT